MDDKTMVTPEMLLFLAGKMGLDRPHAHSGSVMYFDGWRHAFNPHQSDAQFSRLVVWAAMQGLEPMLAKRHAFAGLVGTSSDYTEGHDGTPDSIRAAAVVAICRALGFDAAKEADK